MSGASPQAGAALRAARALGAHHEEAYLDPKVCTITAV